MEKKKILYIGGAIVFILICFFVASSPSDFTPGTIVKVGKGTSLHGVSALLKDANVIRSRIVFEALVILFGDEKHIAYSDYVFSDKLPVYAVAWRIATGDHRMAPVIVTIPEGFNVEEIADAFALKLPNFNKENFLKVATPKEGYLFPDTYFFYSIDTESDVIAAMSETFEEKIKPFRPLIAALPNKSEKEIITMASIIEREAKGDQDRGVISGILWHRIAIGMPLQVDAAPVTYQSKGLPKAPIANPGLLSIKTAIYPESSPYLYYLHDKDGNIHYAKTFAEHKANKLKYL